MPPTRLAQDVFDGFHSQPIEYTPPDKAYIACNPSIHYDGRTWRCIVRCINYRLGGHIPEEPNTQNVMLQLGFMNGGRSTSQLACSIMATTIEDATGHPKSGYPISGFEDCRLFQWKGRMWAIATSCHLTMHGNREICLLELDALHAFISCTPIRGPWSEFYQKNWIPCVTARDELRLIYSIDRSIVIDMPGPRCLERGSEKFVGDIDWRAVGNHRGSSCALQLPSGQLIVLAHTEGYQSRFMLLDGEYMRPTHQTDLFHFRERTVEFAAGMALDPHGGPRLVVSYSVKDATVELGMFPLESVMQKMERIA